MTVPLNTNKNAFVINDERKNIHDSIERIFVQCNFHTSILIIKNKITSTDTFRFELVTLSDIQNEIKSLNPNKATTRRYIPPKNTSSKRRSYW